MERQAAPACADAEEDQVASIVKAFMSLSPPVFKGGYDSVAENWLEEVKKILDVLGVAETRMVSLASYMLRGGANLWWNTVKGTHIVSQMTWEQFEEVFLERYIRPLTRVRKMSEFNELTQGDLSVADYDFKFRELSRYETELVLDEHVRARKFKFGLSKCIFEEIESFELHTYDEVVETALLIENILEEMKYKNGNLSSQDGTECLVIEQCTEQSLNLLNQLEIQGNQECSRCGDVGHLVKNCHFKRQGTQVCFRCGSLDHLVKNCHFDRRGNQVCFRYGELGQVRKNCYLNKRCPLTETKYDNSDLSSQDSPNLKLVQQCIEQSQDPLNQLEKQVDQRCFNCGELGHLVKNCHSKRRCPLMETKCDNSDMAIQDGSNPKLIEQCIEQSQNLLNQLEIQGNQECSRCGQVGHFVKNCHFKIQGNQVCFRCGSLGHLVKNCHFDRQGQVRKFCHSNRRCPLTETKCDISDLSSQDSSNLKLEQQCIEQSQDPLNQLEKQVDQRCFNCGELSHFVKNCHSQRRCPLKETKCNNSDLLSQDGSNLKLVAQCIEQSPNQLNQLEKQVDQRCYTCGELGHLGKNCYSKRRCPLKDNSDLSSQDGSNINLGQQCTEQSRNLLNQVKKQVDQMCFNCGGLGHFVRYCPLEKVCAKCGMQGHVKRMCSFEKTKHENRVRSSQDAKEHQRIEQSTEQQNQNVQKQLMRQVDRKRHHCGEPGHIKPNCPQKQQQ